MSDYGIQEVYCSKLELIESAGGGNLRFCLVEIRGDHEERVIEIIMPGTALPDALLKGFSALAMLGVEAVRAIPQMMMQ